MGIDKLEVAVQNEQKQRRGSVSFLSKQMMAKLLEAEEENDEQRRDFKAKLEKLQKELEQSKEQSFNLEKTRRNSVTQVSQTMFGKLLAAEQNKKKTEDGYKSKIRELEARIEDLDQQLAVEMLKSGTVESKVAVSEMERSKYMKRAEELESKVSEIKQEHDSKERKRRESFSQLQNQYWTKLLEAEDDREQRIKKFKQKIEWLTTSKCNLIIECDKQMNDLRNAVTVY